jgi:hypothetical protein
MKEFKIKTIQYEPVIPGTINNLGRGGAGCKEVKNILKIFFRKSNSRFRKSQ